MAKGLKIASSVQRVALALAGGSGAGERRFILGAKASVPVLMWAGYKILTESPCLSKLRSLQL